MANTKNYEYLILVHTDPELTNRFRAESGIRP